MQQTEGSLDLLKETSVFAVENGLGTRDTVAFGIGMKRHQADTSVVEAIKQFDDRACNFT
ncbi:MAG: hypothetical protein JRH20_27285 [Deltaproteobacteria bacterium]|nr:hypothetical protein [Deltaproteobacteria bacterium]